MDRTSDIEEFQMTGKDISLTFFSPHTGNEHAKILTTQGKERTLLYQVVWPTYHEKLSK